nr:F-actin-monooxygenase Mical isoform X2 [Leptinotarsa decemlineata]
MDRNNQTIQHGGGGRPVSGLEAANANEYFDQFLNATSLKHILGYYRGLIDYLHLKPAVITSFYPKLRANLTSWRAKALWKKFDARASHKCYQKGKLAAGTRVLIIGGGPCGMRAAIEAQLLGAKVVVVEKRDRFSRNNVLHLWPFVIEDLRMLGAKKFFGKFCAGAIDHISIRQLQCILMKVALLLGVEVHTEVSFEKLIEPSATQKTGWRAEFKPANHPVSLYEFDVIIGADGKRNTLQGFSRKEFRGKLAIAITANFINKKTEAEARVEEISGVAFIFNQKFFKDLLAETRIDLENIVYYKDDTHYFVMTAKKASLIEKGVIKQDLADTERLLAPENVDREALQQYAIEAANFSTNYQMPNLEFAVNHYGQPDIAMFDFTSMYAAENASKVLERNGHRLLMILVGDSLLEPFWPTGSGCARGFLSSLDAAWAIRCWSMSSYSPLEVIAERESIYRLLAQTTPDNLNKGWKSYTVDPSTRYPNLNKSVVMPHQVVCLYDTDNPNSIDRMKRISDEKPTDVPKKKKRRGNIDNELLLNWLTQQLKWEESIVISDINSVFRSGKVLCAIIHHYRPDLLDYSAIKNDEPAKNNQIAIDLLEKELGIPPLMTGADITNTDDYLTMASYLAEIYDAFRGEIPHIRLPKLKLPSRIPKPLVLPKPKSSLIIRHTKKETKPCKKCFEAYNSEIKTYPSNHPERKTTQTAKSNAQFPEKNVKIESNKSDVKDKFRRLSRMPRAHPPSVKKKQSNESQFDPRRSEKVDKKRKSTIKSAKETPKEKTKSMGVDIVEVKVPPPPPIRIESISKSQLVPRDDIEEKCLQKIVALRNEKLKSFMTKLLLKKKKSMLKKCTLSVISETNIDIANGKEPLNLNSHNSKIPVQRKEPKCEISENESKEETEKTFEEIRLDNVDSHKMESRYFESSATEFRTGTESSLCNVATMFNKGQDCVNSASERFEQTEELLVEERLSSERCCYEAKSSSRVPSSESLIKIRLIEKTTRNKFTLQNIEYVSSLNQLTISSKVGISQPRQQQRVLELQSKLRYTKCSNGLPKSCSVPAELCGLAGSLKQTSNSRCQSQFRCQTRKFPSKKGTMNEGDCMHNQIYSRVSNWISSNDFLSQDNSKADTDVDTIVSNSKITDITSVSKMDQYDGVRVEERTDVVNFSQGCEAPVSSEEKFAERLKHINNKSVRTLSKFSQYSPFQYGGNLKSASAPPTQFSVIVEGEESDLPESVKISEVSFKTIKTSSVQPQTGGQLSRPSSRQHKRHAEVLSQKTCNVDRKTRKRRTLERVGASVDHDNKTSGQTFRGGGKDEDLAARIKSLENKWRDPVPVDKKPKDLLRAIGKIETSDWNIKEIEKKIQENKMGKPSKAFDREKVPKWSKEQFLARQTKMEKQHLDRQDSVEAKYADIDKSIKNLDQKLKEGTVRELGTNKVATITEKLTSKVPPDPKPVEKSVPRPLPVLPTQGSEMCHFCGKRVYLMERLSAEGRFFHHGCFKCQFCYTQLRLGSYAFDRDGQYGYKFFCLQHFGMVSIAPTVKVTRKPSQRVLSEQKRSPEKKLPSGISGVDLLDKVHTPERIEFSNLSVDHISSDQEDSLSQMDEDEWTDKNFGASCAELDDSDDDSSSMSDTDSDDEDAFDDALEEPVTKEGTMKWAERWKNSYSRKKRNSDSNEFSSSDQSSYYENTSDVIRKLLLFKRFMKLKLRSSRRKDESDTATEGEEEIRARELRKKEVCVEPPIVHTDTGTDTEIVSDETSSESSSEIHNSATEISTDSEFAQDDPTPTREIPSIVLNDFHVTKTRGSGGAPKRIQVTTGFLQRPSNGKSRKPNIELKLKPLVPHTPITTTVKKPAPVLLSRTEGYALNRTQSTGGIAAKVSLELKKKYLLGEQAAGSIQKSGSASTLDTKFKSFHTNISDCQKLLKPATEISASMQTFCNILNERKSPVLSPQSSAVKLPEAPKEEVPPVEAKSAEDTEEFVNVSLGRPRSPVHETSIIVPQIDWSKSHQSLSSDSLASSDDEATKPVPRVEIHTVNDEEPNDDFVPDSLCVDSKTTSVEKSISSEKKALNQPKPLPNLENLLPEIHNSLHIKYKKKDEAIELPKPDTKSLSGVSSPESGTEQATAALTETELSDWARDELASDEFEYAYFEPGVQESGKITKDKDVNELKNKTIITEAMNNILSGNLDNIEFMDTGTETSSDDGVVDSQNGYVLFKNDCEFTEDSLSPNVNDIVEAVNIDADKVLDNSQALKNIKPKDHEEDSLVVVETGTTTEENTCSDSTVRNVTEIGADQRMIQDNKEIIKLSSADTIPEKNKENLDANNIEFEEHCQRLQSRIEFGNVKDSIDVRKSRRKSKPDLIQEDVGLQLAIPKGITLNLTPTHTPDILYNKEILKKERDTNQRVVQEMVMNRMKAENKSLERKRRKNPLSPFDLTKSATTDLVSQINSNNLNKSVTSGSSNYNTPDVLLSTNYPLQNSKTVNVAGYKVETPVDKKEPEKQVSNPEPDTPKAPPRQHRSSSDTLKITDKSKQTVKLRDKEIENLNPAEPELSVITPVKRNSWLYSNTPIKRNIFRRSQSGSYETNHSPQAPVGEDVTNLSARTKSIPDFPQKIILVEQDGCENERDKIFKSDPNILESTGGKSKKKSKDRERRKSITKLITTLFTKKSPSSGSSKGLFSKLSPTKKEVSKDSVTIEPIRKKSFSEGFINRNLVTPPPVPPLPLNYVVRKTDESSDGEHDRKHDHSSCDTLDNTGMFEQSTSSLTGRRSSRSAKRASRQVQHKRHRMAQEIQRKLEETEVKTKVLEQRGVMVEKALRGEDSGSCSKDECDLLQEWFDLMRDRTELRRYERELTVRAQELELEDRHARLQHELRERIELDKEKTEEDVKTEESIINEMINIVEKRDSLIAEIEEDRIRYSNEDRDLEEQMLAKGLRLTPIKKSHEK